MCDTHFHINNDYVLTLVIVFVHFYTLYLLETIFLQTYFYGRNDKNALFSEFEI